MDAENPQQKLIDKRVRIVKMMMLQSGADTSVMSSLEMQVFDQLVEAVMTAYTMYEMVEKVQNSLDL